MKQSVNRAIFLFLLLAVIALVASPVWALEVITRGSYIEQTGLVSPFGRWAWNMHASELTRLGLRDRLNLSFQLNERYSANNYVPDHHPSVYSTLTGVNYSIQARYGRFNSDWYFINRKIELVNEDASINYSLRQKRLPDLFMSYSQTTREGAADNLVVDELVRRTTLRLSKSGRRGRFGLKYSRSEREDNSFIQLGRDNTLLSGEIAGYGELLPGMRLTAGYDLQYNGFDYGDLDNYTLRHHPSINVSARVRDRISTNIGVIYDLITENSHGLEEDRRAYRWHGDLTLAPYGGAKIRLGRSVDDRMSYSDNGRHYSVFSSDLSFKTGVVNSVGLQVRGSRSTRQDNFEDSFLMEDIRSDLELVPFKGLSLLVGTGWRWSEDIRSGNKTRGVFREYQANAKPLPRLDVRGSFRGNFYDISAQQPNNNDVYDSSLNWRTRRNLSLGGGIQRSVDRSTGTRQSDSVNGRINYRYRGWLTLGANYSENDVEAEQLDGSMTAYRSNTKSGQAAMTLANGWKGSVNASRTDYRGILPPRVDRIRANFEKRF